MKIAYLSTFYPLRGGIAQFNASLYRALSDDHEVSAFTFKRQYPNSLFPGKTQYVSPEDKVDEIESLEILDTINPLSYFQTAKAINAYAPDILLMKYWMAFFAPSLGTVAKRMAKKTVVISILDNVIPHEKQLFSNSFTRYFLKQNDGFVAMSDAVQNDLLSLNPNAKCARLGHPIYDHFGEKTDPGEAKQKLGLSPNKKTILFFGFIRNYKGLDLLIEAFGLLDESYQLIIAGECYGSFDKYQKQINNSKNKANIHLFNDYIDDNQVPAFFSASDVCVLPYKSATQSGITSIAYHFEVPVIATDVGGLREVIAHGKTGLIADKPDASLIKDSIEQFYRESLLDQMRENIQMLKEEKSWANFAKAITDFSNTL